MKSHLWMLIALCSTLLLSACDDAQNQSDPTPPAVVVEEITITPTFIPTITPSPTQTKTPYVPLIDQIPTIGSIHIQEPDEILQIGTAIPESDQAITLDNITNLVQVGQWGYGGICDAIYTEDGSKIIVSSQLGFAIYDLTQPKEPPHWVPFTAAYNHNFFMLDENENFIRFMKFNEDLDEVMDELVLTFPDGIIVGNPVGIQWKNPSGRPDPEKQVLATTSDGKKIFDANREPLDPNWDPEMDISTTFISKNYVLDANTEEILFQLPDETLIRSYSDYVEPEGCAITSTAMCSTSHWDLVYLPYRAIFSPNDQTLIVRYSENLPFYTPGFDNTFIRLYDANDGMILGSFGSPVNPVQAFSYAPDGKSVMVAYENGSMQVWNIAEEKFSYSAWHFNDFASSVSFSADDQYVLVRRSDYLEIRSKQNGALKSRLQANIIRYSPLDKNIMAYTDNEYHIKVLNINTSELLVDIPAHEDKIFTIEFSPDGNTIASSSQDCTIKLWDANTGEFLHYFEETIVDPYDPYPHYQEDTSRNTRIFVKRFEFVEGTRQLFGFSEWWIAVNWNIDSGATTYVIYNSPRLTDRFNVDTDANEIYFGNTIYAFDTGEKISGNRDHTYSEWKISPHADDSFTMMESEGRSNGFDLYDKEENYLGFLALLPDDESDLNIPWVYFSKDNTQLYALTNTGVVFIYQIQK